MFFTRLEPMFAYLMRTLFDVVALSLLMQPCWPRGICSCVMCSVNWREVQWRDVRNLSRAVTSYMLICWRWGFGSDWFRLRFRKWQLKHSAEFLRQWKVVRFGVLLQNIRVEFVRLRQLVALCVIHEKNYTNAVLWCVEPHPCRLG